MQRLISVPLLFLLGAVGWGMPVAISQTLAVPGEHARIAWDYSSMQQLAEQGGYPRLKVLRSGAWVTVYEDYHGDIYFRRSVDQGQSWAAPITVFRAFPADRSDSVTIRMSNPELIELANGRLLMACNYRPSKDGVAPFAIAIRESDDQGENWSETEVLFEGGSDFKDGCWEPSFLQLPSGEVQLYFANESPYRESDEQEISVMRSIDNGHSWSDPSRVSFRAERRDGMPVAARSDRDIYLAIEDNKVGEFKPYILRSSVQNSWQPAVTGESPQRWFALDSLQADSVYMGAPYLLRLPSGGYLLSYQTNKDRGRDWQQSTMEVRISGPSARAFSRVTRPFPVPLMGEAKWNALSLLDVHRVAALSSVKFEKDEKVSPWLIQGYILPDTMILKNENDSAHLFVGARSTDQVHLWGKHQDGAWCIRTAYDSGSSEASNSGYAIYFSGHPDQRWRLRVDHQGAVNLAYWVQGDWTERALPPDWSVRPCATGMGHVIQVPAEKHPDFRMGLALYRPDQEPEYLIHMDPQDPQTWIVLKTNTHE